MYMHMWMNCQPKGTDLPATEIAFGPCEISLHKLLELNMH